MEELIKIEDKTFNNETVKTVNARELWKALGSKQDFSNWIKNRISKYEFVENIDFISLNKKIERQIGATERIEYYISLDMAKELCMVENNEKGRHIRKYFIECERKLNKPQEITGEYLIQIGQRMIEAEKRAKEAETKNAILMHVNKTYTATEIAKELNLKSAMELNRILCEKGIQYKVNDTFVFYSKYSNLGYEEIKQSVLDNGHVVYYRRITQLGRNFILSLFKEKNNNQ